MIHRTLAMCSTYSSLAIEFENIRQIGLRNGYPLSFLDTRIGIGLSKYLKKTTTPSNTIAGCEKKRMYLEIPYTGSATDSFKKKLSRIGGKIRPDLDLRFFARPPSSVQSFFQTKDPVSKYLQSNIVYFIKCSDCGDLYVGETERQAIRRLWEHGAPKTLFQDKLINLGETTNTNQLEGPDETAAIGSTTLKHQQKKTTTKNRHTPYPNPKAYRRSSRLRYKHQPPERSITNPELQNIKTDKYKQQNENNTTTKETAISLHQKQTGHKIDWERFPVLCHDSTTHKLRIKESMVIKANESQLNRTTHSVPLLVFPESLPSTLLPNPHTTT